MSAPSTTPGVELPALEQLEAAVWQALVQASKTRGHGWRTATLATVTPEGLPDARTVVLREVRPADHTLLFYTDARSPKVAQMRAQARGLVVCWCPALGWQLRLQVALAVADQGLDVSSRWARLKLTPAAQDYLSPLPPGSRLGAPQVQAASRGHFAVVTARVLAADWLGLAPSGHRRARFEPGTPAQWVQA